MYFQLQDGLGCSDCIIVNATFQEGSISGTVTASFSVILLTTTDEGVTAEEIYQRTKGGTPVAGFTIENLVFGSCKIYLYILNVF